MTFEHLYGDYLGRTGNSVWDPEIASYVQTNIGTWMESIDGLHCRKEFIGTFQQWVESSHLNSFTGLGSFEYRYATLGVTQALDAWHYQAACEGQSKIRLLPGEYPYNRDVYPFAQERMWWNMIDSLIISVPFSGTGELHPMLPILLDEALEQGHDVYVDCAWFGTCSGISIDLSHPAITAVAFSTSKGLAGGNWRAGVCYSRKPIEPLHTQNNWDHSIHLNNRINLEVMKKFGPDHIPIKYREAQEAVCRIYGLRPSPCVHIGLGRDEEWEFFNRGEYDMCRVNLKNPIRDYVKTGKVRT